MELNAYQTASRDTAHYPIIGNRLIYPTLGLVGEAGECAEKIKKVMRNDDGELSDDKRIELKKELGDVLWYLTQLATELDVTLEDVAITNLEKLRSRKERGVIASEGDNR